MFQAVNHSKFASPLPRHCSFEENDWNILAKFWHPVVFAHEVTDHPVKARLLDVDLVVYRTSQGVSVARDLCPHRGTQISNGSIRDDRLVCPMHGLHFDHTGQCTRIPSIENPNARIPPKMRLQSLNTEERYGIVWACFSETPMWPLPDWNGIKDPKLNNVYLPNSIWNAAASRHVENFNDVAHFPWVHKATFGGYESHAIKPYKVDRTDHGLSFELPYLEAGNRFPDGVDSPDREVTYRYELTFPFSTLIEIRPVDSDYVQYFADCVCPVSANESKIFQVATDTTGNPDVDSLTQEATTINDEDKPLVEGQRPEFLPLDLTEEIHIPADRMSIEYRRALATEFGLGAPLTS